MRENHGRRSTDGKKKKNTHPLRWVYRGFVAIVALFAAIAAGSLAMAIYHSF